MPRVEVVVRSRGGRLRERWLSEALAEQTVTDFAVVAGHPSGAVPAAFIDATCRPDPRWLEELLRAAASAPGSLVRGTTLPDPWDARPGEASAGLNVLRPPGTPAGEVHAPDAIVYAAAPARGTRRATLDISSVARRIRPVPSGAMRVALLNPWFWPEVRRGSERLLHDLAVDLTALGHTPRLLTSHPGRTTRSVEDGFSVIRSRRSPERLLRRLNAQENVSHLPFSYRELAHADDDAAVAAYLTDALAAVAWRARTGRPAVYAYMGVPIRRILAAQRGRVQILETVTTGADAVVALSTAARDAIWRWFGVEAHVIAPGVDLERFKPGGERAPEPTIACAADPGDPRKCVEAIVAAFAAVRREHPTATLRLIKPRDPAVEQRLAAPGVTFAALTSEQMPGFYRGAWATGLASQDEAFGLVLTESLACGTPAFGRRAGGVGDIIASDAVGRLFDDEADLGKTMLETLELAADPGTAAACRAHAEQFSSRNCALGYEALLRSL